MDIGKFRTLITGTFAAMVMTASLLAASAGAVNPGGCDDYLTALYYGLLDACQGIQSQCLCSADSNFCTGYQDGYNYAAGAPDTCQWFGTEGPPA